MGEFGYQANVPSINRGAKELESLAGKAEYLLQRFITDKKGTDGWQGHGDQLAVSLTGALEKESKEIESALGSIQGLLDALFLASNMGRDVRKPADDALRMIAEGKGRH